MKQFNVRANCTFYYDLEIAADSMEEAITIVRDMDNATRYGGVYDEQLEITAAYVQRGDDDER